MAGFLGLFNYSRPGRGVSKDERKKRAFFVFFEIFYRKIWNFCKLSLEYTLFVIPCFIAYLGLSAVIMAVAMQDFTNNGLYVIYAAIALALFLSSFFSGSPAGMGRALVLRCYARESHAFIWGDFIDGMRFYLGKAIGMFFIDAAVAFIAAFNIIFCFIAEQPILPDMFMLISGILTLIVVLMWMMAQPYLGVLTVTQKMSFGKTYRTAFALVVARLPQNLLTTVISAAVFLTFIYLTLTQGIVFILLFPLLLFAFCGFITHFNATRVMDSYFETEEKDEIEPLFTD